MIGKRTLSRRAALLGGTSLVAAPAAATLWSKTTGAATAQLVYLGPVEVVSEEAPTVKIEGFVDDTPPASLATVELELLFPGHGRHGVRAWSYQRSSGSVGAPNALTVPERSRGGFDLTVEARTEDGAPKTRTPLRIPHRGRYAIRFADASIRLTVG